MPTIDDYRYDDAWETEGNVITSDIFGTNLLAHRPDNDNDLDLNDNAIDVIEAVGIGNLRYPGGNIAETQFDLSDPDGGGFNPNDPLVSLTNFLQYVSQQNIRATIVIPTSTYWEQFDTATGELSLAAQTEIAQFVQDLVNHSALNGQRELLDAIEIGNEYNTWLSTNANVPPDRQLWTPEEFGALSAAIAGVVHDTLQNTGGSNPRIFVQAGNSLDDDRDIRGQFSDELMSQIDGVISHLYAGASNGDPMAVGAGVSNELDWIRNHWGNLDIMVSEWNIGDPGEDATAPGIQGLARSAGLLRIFNEMMEAGVDVTHIWAAENRTGEAVLGQDGTAQLLTPTGLLFRMMSETLIGTQIETGGLVPRDDAGNRAGYTMTFRDDHAGRVVAYFASGEDYEQTFVANYSQVFGDMSNVHVYATILGSSGAAATDRNVQGQLKLLNHDQLDPDRGWTFEVDLEPYEVVQFVFTQVSGTTGVFIRGDDQNAVSDTIMGTDINDTLMGELGNDSIEGYSGNDSILGGAGNDTLNAGDGNDDVQGGVGSDQLNGGSGNDTLLGLDGFDQLNGNDGNDSLSSGAGNDTLDGGSGNDTLIGGLGFDSIDGGSGNDTLLGLAGQDTLLGGAGADSLSAGAGNDSLEGGSGNDTLIGGIGFDTMLGGDGDDLILGRNGFDRLEGGSGNDNLEAGSGNDTLSGGVGDDLMRGGQGADVFVFNSGNDRIRDYSLIVDALEIDADLLNETIPVESDLANYSSVVDGNLVLDFGDGNTLTINKLTNVSLLFDDVMFV
ncbi:calcium-binding protein [uncultured Tateyamaria sp.]|uniref:calcium-binding protein n=1 Tax=uncultured Tateyamaria sp. TaxID=455651 RepID=UPI002631A2B8|nr:calcium-binding protein [uncultured Tateyamaria sp.]